jgi:hypothetical protein
MSKKLHSLPLSIRRIIQLGGRWPSRLVATASEGRVSTTIWSGGAAVGLYLGSGLMLAFLVHTHYPGALGLREWIRVILSWPLIFFLRSK